jgi:HTH-type transcriptional regulator / antitoxin HigA
MTNPDIFFYSDWVSPAAETIMDLIEEREWSQVELAKKLGSTTNHLNQLIKGKVALTEVDALSLAHVLGSTVNFWLNREIKYRQQ